MFISLITLFSMSRLFCLVSLAIHRKHFLISLLYLEAFILSVALLIPTILLPLNRVCTIFVIVLLTIGACEASLGLSLLVRITRSYGNDLMKSIRKNLC